MCFKFLLQRLTCSRSQINGWAVLHKSALAVLIMGPDEVDKTKVTFDPVVSGNFWKQQVKSLHCQFSGHWVSRFLTEEVF